MLLSHMDICKAISQRETILQGVVVQWFEMDFVAHSFEKELFIREYIHLLVQYYFSAALGSLMKYGHGQHQSDSHSAAGTQQIDGFATPIVLFVFLFVWLFILLLNYFHDRKHLTQQELEVWTCKEIPSPLAADKVKEGNCIGIIDCYFDRREMLGDSFRLHRNAWCTTATGTHCSVWECRDDAWQDKLVYDTNGSYSLLWPEVKTLWILFQCFLFRETTC